jgi:hypothetical protein
LQCRPGRRWCCRSTCLMCQPVSVTWCACLKVLFYAGYTGVP